jgi:lysophospholipase L1-like esterase
MRVVAALLLVLSLGSTSACSDDPPTQPSPPPSQPPPPPPPPPPDPPVDPPAPPPVVPRVAKVRYLAFGDSLTEGVVSAPLTDALVTIPHAYPAKLQDALRARYSDQPEIAVFNEGLAGEFAADGRGRLPDAIKAHAPEVLLLMEGANELNLFGEDGVTRTVIALEDMIKEGRRRGLVVFVATLPAQRPGGPKAFGAPYVEKLNAQLRKTALEEGAGVVDVHAQLDLSFVGTDGLHLTEAGYARLAEIFAATIRQAFEQAPPAS